MFQLRDSAGRIKLQLLHFKGGVNVQLFDHETGGNRFRGVSVHLFGDELSQAMEGLQQEAAEAAKVGGDGS